jgi:hypothetical protein
MGRILKIDRFFIFHQAFRMDGRSIEIRQGFVKRGGGRWMSGDMMELQDYTYEDEDEGYESAAPSSMGIGPSSPPVSSSGIGQFTQEQGQNATRRFPKWVKYLVDLFMDRGTNGPVPWWMD